jgi:hypothetical protein
MDRSRLLQLVVRLGGEFSRRGMAEHCRRLRVYYLALQHGLDTGRGRLEVHWDEDLTIEWFRLLRLPPYQDHYPVQDDGRCTRCEDRPGSVFTVAVFPGGTKLECRTCGRQWLVLRDTADPQGR